VAHQAAEDVSKEGVGLDVDPEAVGPHAGFVRQADICNIYIICVAHQAAEDVSKEGVGLDVDPEAVGPHAGFVRQAELQEGGLQVPARRVQPSAVGA
jgi:hypothetical protein